jgi:nickel-dependent lactate racemase
LNAYSDSALEALFTQALLQTLSTGVPGPVLVVPPDLTRIHSRAGLLAGVVCRVLASPERYGLSPLWRLGGILPALGTHRPLSDGEIARMFPLCPPRAFIAHNWRSDTLELGRLEAEWVKEAFTDPAAGTEEARAFCMDWPVQVNRLLLNDKNALIISIGQVVPHEVAGMSNHAKNIFIGCGGEEGINKSHWLGALYGLERIMGISENPVRALFDEALRRYGGRLAPVLWALTVVDNDGAARGLFCGHDRRCFEDAAALSANINISRLKKAAQKIVVYLDPAEYRSCWLGNKAVYRSRLALASGGELLILAPALDRFGEDKKIDALIRRSGYRGAGEIRRAVERGDLDILSAAAHLIHGSSEGRFTIRYCTGPGLSRADIEAAGYQWGNLEEMSARYRYTEAAGWRATKDGEEFYFIKNPALGLWTSACRCPLP